jgi:hypothetical protein
MPLDRSAKRYSVTLIIGLTAFLWACTQSSDPTVDGRAGSKGAAMNAMQPNHHLLSIPAIDADRPVKLDTATFGLG